MVRSFSYKLRGLGWADCIIEFDQCTFTIDNEYNQDTVGDLIEGLVALLEDTTKDFYVHFDKGNSIYSFWIQRIDNDTISIAVYAEVYDLEEPIGDYDDPPPVPELVELTGLKAFARLVIDALYVNISKGVHHYNRRWNRHKFPEAKYLRLIELTGN